MPISDYVNLAFQKVREVYDYVSEAIGSTPGQTQGTRAAADPNYVNALGKAALTRNAPVMLGLVTDASPIGHLYRVQVGNNLPPLVCTVGSLGDFGPIGARSLQTIPAGSWVLVWVDDTQLRGVILACLPDQSIDPAYQLATHIAHTTRHRTDEASKWPYKAVPGHEPPSYTSGRPFDSTVVGEWGYISPLGPKVVVDPFMALLGVDQSCGLFTFYHDRLLRLAAYNFRMFTAGCEREGMNDQGEYNDYEGYTPYPWEQLGLYAPDDAGRDVDDADWQHKQPHYGPWEPADDRQRPFHRVQTFRGYLGQGVTQLVKIPPDAGADTSRAKYGQDQPDERTVSLWHFGLDGRVVGASAKSIILGKIPWLNALSRRYVPEQIKDEGDNQDNYKAAGLLGNGPDHRITYQWQGEGYQRLLGMLDWAAYVFNYLTVHPLFYHEKDWQLSGEELQLGWDIPDYSQVDTKALLDPPQPVDHTVDHRASSEYFPNACFVSFNDDGSVSIVDGWGSQISMIGGRIILEAPHGVDIRSGRTTSIEGGHDVVVRAKNSLDLVTTEKDIRLKAERNLHALAGNAKSGGILLESRSQLKFDFEKNGEDTTSGGIILRSLEGGIVAWGGELYLRSTAQEGGKGRIVLDADKGQGRIRLHAYSEDHFLSDTSSGTVFFFGQEGSYVAASQIAPRSAILHGHTSINGHLYVNGRLLTRESITVADGHISTSQAEAFDGKVGQVQNVGPALQALQRVSDIAEADLPDAGSTIYDAEFDADLYEEKRAGNDEVLEKGKFSLRTEKQYKTTQYVRLQPLWTQLAEAKGNSLSSWSEKPVEGPDGKTYPYPGKQHFQESGSLVNQPLQLFNLSPTLKPVSRGTPASLASGYLRYTYPSTTSSSLNEVKIP